MTVAHRLSALFVVLTFVTSFIAAGDGVAPVGCLMVVGWGYWTAYIVPAWIGVTCLIIGTMIRERSGRWMVVAGSGFLALNWVAMIFISDNAVTTILFSTHFLASVSVLLAMGSRR